MKTTLASIIIGIAIGIPASLLVSEHIIGALFVEEVNSLGEENRMVLDPGPCCPGVYFDYEGGPLVFRVRGVEHRSPLTLQEDNTVVINPDAIYDGNLINTLGHELSVNGGILCEEIMVISDVPSSDHVFENNYDLATLSEVKDFIQEHGHLPGVPSAEEFKDGYKLGEMDDILLRKIEELTLYLIAIDSFTNRISY